MYLLKDSKTNFLYMFLKNLTCNNNKYKIEMAKIETQSGW